MAISLAALASAACPRLEAQTPAKASVVIAGVTDAQSGAPLADAQVSVSDLNVSARTDWSGEVRIPNVAAGQHKFEIRRSGYAPLDVDLMVQGDSMGPVFRLAKAETPTGTPALEPVKVAGDPSTSYLADFERRRAQGRGRFLRAGILERCRHLEPGYGQRLSASLHPGVLSGLPPRDTERCVRRL